MRNKSKIFAASTFSDVSNIFVKLLNNKTKGKRVLFIENAGDPYKGIVNFIDPDYNAFIKYKFDVTILDLRIIDSKEFLEIIKRFDIIHMCGGSAIYLLNLLKKKGFFDIIKEFVIKGKIIYTSTSAGSMILAPDISFCCDDEDEMEAGQIGKLKDSKGLGLIPFYFMCHAQERNYVPSTLRAVQYLPDNEVPILFLNDNMCLYFEKDKFMFLSN